MLSLAALSLLLASAPGCGPAEADQAGVDPQAPAAQTITVAVAPMVAAVAPSAAYAFAATVTGSADTAVTWSVEEAGGGTVDSAGLYTAPGSSGGPYHVVAKSVADPSKLQRATVTITASGTVTPPPPPPPVSPGGPVVAFPGAEGGGASATGGRGGAVIRVTNLNDSGPGSLRACLQASGTRTCVFTVGGIIRTSSALVISNPNVTVAGQTAPGGGIAIKNAFPGTSCSMSDLDVIHIRASNVILRYLRVWRGPESLPAGMSPGSCGGTGIDISSSGYHDVVVDHCSILWAPNKALSIWDSSGPSKNITVSWTIAAEPIRGHAVGFLTGGGNLYPGQATDLDFHHNFLASNTHRMPLFKSRSGRWVNNIAYNKYMHFMHTAGGVNVDVISNIFKTGPMDDPGDHPVHAYLGGTSEGPTGNPTFYVSDNKGPITGGTEWQNTTYEISSNEGGPESNPLSTSYQRSSRLPAGTTWNGSALVERPGAIPITVTPVAGDKGAALESLVLGDGGVGASQRVDCTGKWVPVRDVADARIIAAYLNNSGPPQPVLDVGSTAMANGSLPAISAGTACTDTDGDGMPDEWEVAHGLNPNDPSDGPKTAANGYTNLENYMNAQ